MRTLTTDLFVTVDGYARGENSPAYFGYFGPDLEAWIAEEVAKPQVVLMGRVTYETMAAISATGEYDDANRLTDTPKVVFSRTLRDATWANTELISSDLGEAVRELKEQNGPPMRTIGSLTLVNSLLRLGVVDRIRLVVFPQVLGETGTEPILTDLPDLDLELIDTTVLDGRLVVLEYRPAA